MSFTIDRPRNSWISLTQLSTRAAGGTTSVGPGSGLAHVKAKIWIVLPKTISSASKYPRMLLFSKYRIIPMPSLWCGFSENFTVAGSMPLSIASLSNTSELLCTADSLVCCHLHPLRSSNWPTFDSCHALRGRNSTRHAPPYDPPQTFSWLWRSSHHGWKRVLGRTTHSV